VRVRGIPIENGNVRVLFITRWNPRNDSTCEEGYVWVMLMLLIVVKNVRVNGRVLVKVILLNEGIYVAL